MLCPRKIALFGGTFDPVHQGHLEVASRARDEMDLDEVIFLPCRRSPHKGTGPVADDHQRISMLKAATANFPWASVSDFEINRPAPSYTWKTVEAFIENLPSETLIFLLIGLDQWLALPRWAHPEKLTASVKFLVFGRNGQPEPREGYRAHFFQSDHPAYSSLIREELACGNSSEWLPEAVVSVINEEKIYR